jgi:adenine-specific DNA-methyltransferase
MKLSSHTPKQSLNKAYLKEKVGRLDIENFKKNFSLLLSKINEQESEEHLKNIISDFLKDTWYKDLHEINTKDRNDLVIHTGKTSKEPVGVIIEVKKPSNKTEMISEAKPNAKAMHELILYYFRERIEHNNIDTKYLIITNIYEWYIFDEVWFDKNVFRNSKLKKDYENWKLSGHDTKFFYDNIAKPFLESVSEAIPCTFFDIRQYQAVIENGIKKEDNKLIALYKILSPVNLLKHPFANDSNSLDTKFYAELLHIIGLEEIKDGGKKLIKRKEKSDVASLLENTILKLEDKEVLRNIPNLSVYGEKKEDQLFSISLELCITWINRVLFLKLLEAQLYKYHKGDKEYIFLNTQTIFDFDELSSLFFQVLAEKQINRREHIKDKYSNVPYLNSSLFERTELERATFDISALDNRLELPLFVGSVLKDVQGKRKSGKLPVLQYLFDFLEAYDFTSEGKEEIQEENKNLINASVLGLIFEKINGYKDGSFFTPGFITMYMCKETIRKAVSQKFNEHYKIDCETFEDLKNFVAGRFKPKDILEFNTVINELKICDPAVGSGHFLVSALNELIAIKAELGILADKEGSRLSGYEVKIENDELIVTYNNNSEIFEYSITNGSVNKETQRIQKTFFHEKETIIENCLFGVDINPNSVKICRLRLWIELLKNAYYKDIDSLTTLGGFELETLPNIDINIKCGNSLISRFQLDTDLSKALKTIKWDIKTYKGFVHDYHHAGSKEEKQGLEKLIEQIKKDFRTEINKNDKKYQDLSKFKGKLLNLTTQTNLFGMNAKQKENFDKEIEIITKQIAKLEAEIDEIKNNKIYENAFEWRFEFPEVLDSEGNFIGFDAVIGNPPYVQLQKLNSEIKTALEQQQFETFGKTGDLYQLFYEQGVKLLKSNGWLGYITSNKWMRTDYGSVTRKFLSTKCNTELVVDFGMAQMFSSATTYTNILFLSKAKPTGHIVICRIKDDYNIAKLLKDYIQFTSVKIPSPGENSWIAYDKREYELIQKIISKGIPLKEWDIRINRGILTGFNEAFIIDTETKNKLVSEDPKSLEIIKPILRGEDIKAYVPEWANFWVIGTFPALNIDISNYPAIERYLTNFKERLTPKPKKHNELTKWKGRKSGSYEWFETQDSISYYEDFMKPKIIYPNMTKFMPFVYDKHQFFTNQKCFIITGEYLGYLTAFLNSKLFRFAFKEYFPELLGDTRELSKVFFENVTTVTVNEDINETFEFLVDKIQELKKNGKQTYEIEQEIEIKLAQIYSLSTDDITLVESSAKAVDVDIDRIIERSVSESS